MRRATLFIFIIGTLMVGVFLLIQWRSNIPHVAFVGLDKGSSFTGGVIRATATNIPDRIAWTRFAYKQDNQWNEIATDTGGIADASKRREIFFAYWDITGLAPGIYRLRAVMQSATGSTGTSDIDVVVSQKPIPAAQIFRSPTGGILLDAAPSQDPSGSGIAEYRWSFDNATIPVIGKQVQRVFPKERTSFITLVVKNNYGGESQGLFTIRDNKLASVSPEQVQVALGDFQNDLLRTAVQAARKKSPNTAGAQNALREADTIIDQAKQLASTENWNTERLNAQVLAQTLQTAQERIRTAYSAFATSGPAFRQETETLRRILSRVTALEIPAIRLKANETSMLANLVRGGYLALLDSNLLLQQDGNREDAFADLKEIIKKLDRIIELMEKAEELLKANPPDIKGARAALEEARAELRRCIEALKQQEGIPPDLIERLKAIYLELGIIIGKLWLLEEIGLDNSHADIPLPHLTRNEYPQYHDLTGDLQMGKPASDPGDDNVFDDAVLYHELDHHFLFQKNRDNLPGGKHWYDEHLNQAHPGEGEWLAWSEGWANFSSAAKRKDPHYLDEGEDDKNPPEHHFTKEKDLENDRCKNTGENTMHPNQKSGSDVEGSVSGILWDIFDGADTGTNDTDNDGVSIPFKYIWEAINRSPHPKNIKDFYKNLKEVLKDNPGLNTNETKLDDIFKNHGVPVP